MSTRRIKLRRPGVCAICHATVEVGTEAMWTAERQTVTCLPCVGPAASNGVHAGAAGASARAKADRLRADQVERHRQLKARSPILGRIKLAIANEPVAGASWATGAAGEERYGATLDQLAADGAVAVLHDRRVPRTSANIDHIVIDAGGVWVVDTKRYRGTITQDQVGAGGATLRIAGRDRTALVRKVQRQVGRIREALGELAGDVDVRGALCFVDAEVRGQAEPFTIADVLVSWGNALGDRFVQPGDLDADDRAALHRYLARSFPPAAA